MKDSNVAKIVERRFSAIFNQKSAENMKKSPAVNRKSERSSTHSLEKRLGYTPKADNYLNRVRNSSRKQSNDSR